MLVCKGMYHMYLVCISVLVGVACLHHSAIHFEPAALAEAALPCPCHSLTFGHLQGKKTGNHCESEATASVRDCCALRQVATW